MFELKRTYPKQPQQFRLLLEHERWYKIWQIMNEVKPIHLIPGLNMMTVYQLSEYFEVPVRFIHKIENKYHLGNPIDRRFVRSDEFSFLALNKKRVLYEGVNHWQYDFKDFSIHMAAAGAICYSPMLIEDFLPYITGVSQVCSDIVLKIIKSFSYDTLRCLGAEGLLRSVEEYEAEQRRIEAKKAKEIEAKKVLNKVLANMQIEYPAVTVEVKMQV